MANPFRNEVEIDLGGTKFRLRATFAAIAEIEDHFDTALIDIVINKLENGLLRANDIKFIVQAGTNAAETPVDDAVIENAIATAGAIQANNAVTPFLAQAFYGAPTTTEKKTRAKRPTTK